MTKGQFKTEVVLSILTGRLLCDFSEMHECIEFLAGEPVFTHQLANRDFVDELASAVRFQLPALDSLETQAAVERLCTLLSSIRGQQANDALMNWVAESIWPIHGTSVKLISMPNMRHAEKAFVEPLKRINAIVIAPDGELA
jgi:hypothetical protein